MRINVFILFFLISSYSFAQSSSPKLGFDWLKISPLEDYTNFDWDALPDGFSRQMAESLLQYNSISSPDPITILHIGDQVLALLPCRFDVLLWSDSAWVNLYRGSYAGFNCNNHFFVRDSILYSYGTYGFWKNHSELLEFNFENGNWESIQVENIPQEYGGNANFLSGTNLLSLFGNYINQSTKKYTFEPDGYYLNFAEKKWSELRIDLPNQEVRDHKGTIFFDLKDYGFLLFYRYMAVEGALLLHKKDLSLKFLKKPAEAKSSFLIASAFHNTISIHYSDHSFMIFDVDQELAKFEQVGEVILKAEFKKEKEKKTQEISGTNWSESVFSFFAFPLVLVSLILLSRYKKILFPSFATKTLRTKKENLKNKEFNILHEILEYRGTLITGEKFDKIVGINLISNLDTKRVMRSKMIKSLNNQSLTEHGSELITRIKSTEDRRIIYYSIANNKSINLSKVKS